MPHLRPGDIDDDCRAFVEAWYPAAIDLAQPFQRRCPKLWDEIEGAAHWGLLKAAVRRAEARDFGGFLNHHVRRAIFGAILSAGKCQRDGKRVPRPEVAAPLGAPGVGLDAYDHRGRGDETLEGREAVAAILGGLCERQASAIRLTVVDGYSHDEAAARLGCGTRTVGTHVRRGMLALRGAGGPDEAMTA